MNVSCPQCEAENTASSPGEEIICGECFHSWVAGGDGDTEAAAETPEMPDLGLSSTNPSAETLGSEAAGPALGVTVPFDTDSQGAIAMPSNDGAGSGETQFGTDNTMPEGIQDTLAYVEESQPIDATDDNENSFLFNRRSRKQRSLSDTDVTMIGDYQRRNTAEADEDGWPESGAAGEATDSQSNVGAKTPDPSIDPFSDTAVVWKEDPSPSKTETWGVDDVDLNDPFASIADDIGSDDASSLGEGGDDDPFALDDDSLGADSDDPFGDLSADLIDDDPFASDPFGGLDTGDGDDSSSTPVGDTDSSSEDPESEDGVEKDGSNLSSFFDGLDEVGLQVDDDDASGEGLFEQDSPSGNEEKSEEELELDGLGIASDSKPRKKKKSRRAQKKGIMGLAVLLCLVGLMGLGLGQTEYGYFGMNLLLEDTPQQRPSSRQSKRRQRAKNQAAPKNVPAVDVVSPDGSLDYVKRIKKLRKKLEKSPLDVKSRQDIVQTLLRLRERYPAVFKAEPKYTALLGKLLTPDDLKQDLRLQAAKLLAEEKHQDAEKVLEKYVASMTSDPSDLYLMARIARVQGRTEQAIVFYERILEVSGKFEPALFDLGEIDMERDDMVEARKRFAKLLEVNPNHSGAQLALAQLALYERDFESAKKLTDTALNAAKETKDRDQQFRAFWLKAMLAEAQTNQEERAYALTRALEIHPSDERTALALSELLLSQGKHQESLARLLNCRQAGCDGASFHVALVKAYDASGQAEVATRQLVEALEKHPKDTGLLMLHAERESSIKHLKTAKSIYDDVIQIDPKFNHAYLKLADIQYDEGLPRDAIETLVKGSVSVDDTVPLLEKMAEFQVKIGATLKAKKTMDDILKIDPNNTDVKLRFAKLLESLGFRDESAQYFQDLHTAGALNTADLLVYSWVLYELNRYEESLRLVNAVLAGDPLSVRANVLLGAVLTAKEDYAQADKALKKALSINSKHAQVFFHLGKNEAAQKRLAAAVDHYAKAASLDSTDLLVREELARALTELGGLENRQEALSHYSFILRSREELVKKGEQKRIDPDTYFRRGRLFFENGEFGKAMADFKQAMVLDPVRLDLVVEFARTLSTMGRDDEAAAYLKEVLARDSKNAAAHFLLGVSAMKADQRNVAEDHFKRTVASGGADFPVAHRYLGYIYKDKGLRALSCNAFREYLRVAPRDAYDRLEIAEIASRSCR